MSSDFRHARPRGLALLFALSLMLAGCTPAGPATQPPGTPGGADSPGVGSPDTGTPVVTSGPGADSPGPGGEGRVTMLSTQLEPIEEQEKMRNAILANFEGEAEFIAEQAGPFTDRITAEAQAGRGSVDVAGGLHGDFAAFDPETFTDLSDLAAELSELGIPENFLELGRLGTDRQVYIPWMQATYVMAARNEALEHLPEGADLNNLTWEQVTEWGRNIEEATGSARLGFPANLDGGLLHRFFQGYAYPSFTGGVNTTFNSPAAVEMWQWLQDTWQYVNPQSSTYTHMQVPLQSGEVWVAWDHTARLIEALRADPENMVAFPSPSGPEGLGFMPVLAGLAIPANAPNPEGARDLIRYLLQPETQAVTLEQVAFFPVVEGVEAGDLDPGIVLEQEAVQAQAASENAIPSLLPVGLGDLGGQYNKVFQDSFLAIIDGGSEPAGVLEQQAQILQGILEQAGAECWPPDPPSEGVCQVEQ